MGVKFFADDVFKKFVDVSNQGFKKKPKKTGRFYNRDGVKIPGRTRFGIDPNSSLKGPRPTIKLLTDVLVLWSSVSFLQILIFNLSCCCDQSEREREDIPSVEFMSYLQNVFVCLTRR